MSAAQKMTLAAILPGLLGMAAYEASQNALLRSQNAALRRDSEATVESIQTLQLEYEKATNRLASFDEERRRVQADKAELLRLRAEVTRLHHAERRSEDGKGILSSTLQSLTRARGVG